MAFFRSLTLFGVLLYSTTSLADVAEYFKQIKTQPQTLYAFLKAMPKGGELHYHLAGGAYTEAMIQVAAKANYCLDKNDFSIAPMIKQCIKTVPAKEMIKNPILYRETLRAWSMKDFIPGKESNHDHFFNSFFKFMPMFVNHSASLLADSIQRAANQHEQYMEIMILPDNAKSTRFAPLIKKATTYDEKRQRLMASTDFLKNIQKTKKNTTRLLQKTKKKLGCQKHPQSEACTLTVKFQYYLLREQPLDQLFAQALNGFEAVSGSDELLGINLVQAEDGPISMRDYHKQMELIGYLHKHYPNVRIALHAGELTPALVPAGELKSHIRDAILKGHAERIGHGVDIQNEPLSKETTQYMSERQIPVEINLISNKIVLGVSEKEHPLNYYLDKNVPVVLSTDDEGILRTDLTQQYLEAALNHSLDYQTLKQINRNALTYSFLPGKSLWANPRTAARVADCQSMDSNSCKQFISNNQKADLQWRLEKKLEQFEKQF